MNVNLSSLLENDYKTEFKSSNKITFKVDQRKDFKHRESLLYFKF